MTDAEFAQYAAAHIKDYLPLDYQAAQVFVTPAGHANDERYDTIAVVRPGQAAGPKVPVDEFAKAVRGGRSVADVMRELAGVIVNYRIPAMPPGADIRDFSRAKQRLRTKLCDPENCRDYLSDKPWTPVGAWALTYRLEMAERGNMVGSAPVTHRLMQMWGVDAETLHGEAVAKESAADPPRLRSLADGSKANLLEGPPLAVMAEPAVFSLSNRSGFNGACVVGWDGVLERVADTLRCSYFVVPVSVHEVLVFPDLGQTSAQDLELKLQHSNADPMLMPVKEDILSNRIQYYSRGRRELGPAY